MADLYKYSSKSDLKIITRTYLSDFVSVLVPITYCESQKLACINAREKQNISEVMRR